MSDTTFVHEIRTDVASTRVQLTMDLDEVQALGLVATAAVDASVLVPDMVDDSTADNALELLRWSTNAGEAIEALTPSGKE